MITVLVLVMVMVMVLDQHDHAHDNGFHRHSDGLGVCMNLEIVQT